MAEGSGLLNRYTVESPYRGFESLPLRFDKLIVGEVAEWTIAPVLKTGVLARGP